MRRPVQDVKYSSSYYSFYLSIHHSFYVPLSLAFGWSPHVMGRRRTCSGTAPKRPHKAQMNGLDRRTPVTSSSVHHNGRSNAPSGGGSPGQTHDLSRATLPRTFSLGHSGMHPPPPTYV